MKPSSCTSEPDLFRREKTKKNGAKLRLEKSRYQRSTCNSLFLLRSIYHVLYIYIYIYIYVRNVMLQNLSGKWFWIFVMCNKIINWNDTIWLFADCCNVRKRCETNSLCLFVCARHTNWKRYCPRVDSDVVYSWWLVVRLDKNDDWFGNYRRR